MAKTLSAVGKEKEDHATTLLFAKKLGAVRLFPEFNILLDVCVMKSVCDLRAF